MNDKYNKTLVTPVEYEMWSELRRISFEKNISMAQLTRWAVEKLIDRHKKPVDNEL